jgi:hypothetical protein
MTNDSALWITLHEHLPRKTWVPITDIYTIVQHRIPLDEEDLESRNASSGSPCWKSNVRRVLHSKQREGTLLGRKSL